MRSAHERHTVLVPILGEDISDNAFTVATSMLKDSDSRLVLLHITPAYDCEPCPPRRREPPAGELKWQRLASTLPVDRTFIDAAVGDPKVEILAEAERFHSDVILL